MTREEILAKWDAMTPRERDAWIHEKIFNQYVHWCTSGDGSKYPICVPQYSKKIEAAWEVVEKIKEKGFWLYLTSDWPGEYWNAIFRHKSDDSLQSGWYETASHAICLAALLAVGVEHGQG